jgi:AraC-like ligand binding domain
MRARPLEGVERIEAWFQDKAYAMHRHDTYAIGRTLAGVRSFNYRRSRRDSLPRNTIVLHPDEAHDGQAGTSEGFRYRMIYVEPALFQDVPGSRRLSGGCVFSTHPHFERKERCPDPQIRTLCPLRAGNAKPSTWPARSR